jgi:hypothetical protein
MFKEEWDYFVGKKAFVRHFTPFVGQITRLAGHSFYY